MTIAAEETDATEVGAGERVAFIGRTGSGKSFLARALLADVRRLVVFDPKGSLGKPEWGLDLWDSPDASRVQQAEFRLRVRTPLDGNWDPWIWPLMREENITLYVDEVYGVVSGSQPSDALRAIITRGREQGLGVWSATQRPASIPLVFISEADWFFMFQLRLEDDKRRMASFLGEEAFYPLRGHNVIVYNDAWDSPEIYERVNVAPMRNQPSYRKGFQ